MSDLVVNIEPENFSSIVLSSSSPVLVDFWAPWCGPCKSLAPILDQLAEELAGHVSVVKINADKAQELAGQYGVRSIPALLLFRDGALVDSRIGAPKKADLLEWLCSAVGIPVPSH